MRDGSTVSFAILGCGMIANIHAEAIKSLPDANLVGAADNYPSSAEAFTARHGGRAYRSYDELLEDADVDAVCICTPSCFHAENAIAALEMGKHVVLEKPMALTCEDADRVIEASERAGRLVTVVSQLRFSEDVIRVKELVSSGALGKVSICSLRMKYYRSREYYSSWKGTKRFDGGGALMNQGIHGIDLLQYIAGPVKDVDGRVATVCHSIEVEDTAVATFELESGALGVIEASTCAYPGFERRLEIHGDRGYVWLKEDKIERLMIDGREQNAESAARCGTAGDPTSLDHTLHARQLANLMSAIKGEGTLVSDCRAGKQALDVIERIYNSSPDK